MSHLKVTVNKIINNNIPLFARRKALTMTSCGFGYLALRGMIDSDVHAGNFRNPLSERAPHFPAKAKRVIFMFMQGGPSHLDTFDYKPELVKSGGKKEGGKALLPPVYNFHPHGESGLMISELYPNLAKHAGNLWNKKQESSVCRL